MKAFFKSIDINKFTTKITFEHGNSLFYPAIRSEVEAIGILLGNFRSQISQEKYNELREKFDGLLKEVNENIH